MPIYERGEIGVLSDQRIYHSWETHCCSYLSNTVQIFQRWWRPALPMRFYSGSVGDTFAGGDTIDPL